MAETRVGAEVGRPEPRLRPTDDESVEAGVAGEARSSEPARLDEAMRRARDAPGAAATSSSKVEPGLRVGAADAPEEREADAVAVRVVRALADDVPTPGPIEVSSGRGSVGRVRRSASAGSGPEGPAVDDAFTRTVDASRGRPLDEPVRRDMETAFGHDFSAVRVHTGGSADRLNRQIDSSAFATANNVFFANGAYDPATAEGQGLLAHELTHVVQDSSGGTARRSVIRRRLSSESTKAFTTAVRSNPGYAAKQTLVDKVPGSDLDNLTDEEQDKINDLSSSFLGRIRTKKHRTGADEEAEQLDALGDLIRARNLAELATRTAAWHGAPVGRDQRYRTENAKKKGRKAYLKKAIQQRNKDKNLLRLGVAAPETRQFLKEHGFTRSARDVHETTNPVGPQAGRENTPRAKTRPAAENALGVTTRQDVSEWMRGPRIDVRSTFIGGAVLGIMVRAHLFIVYTGRDGRQMYFRGGPSELDHTFADHGEYTADTVDYDPSAPSVTVLQGEEAEAKLDAMISAARRINAMRVPYEAAIAPGPFKNAQGDNAQMVGQALATDGENCNRTAWTILNDAGVPTKKPAGKHPGWGAPLGSSIAGELGMRGDEADQLLRPITHTLTAAEGDDRGWFVQSYVDRALFQKKAKLPVGDTVEIIAEGPEYRTVLWNGQKHFIAKSRDEQRRYDIFTVRDHVQSKGWTADRLQILVDGATDATSQHHQTSIRLLSEMEHELGVDMQTICNAMELHLDDNVLYMDEELDKMSDGQLKEMLVNVPRLLNFARLVHQPSGSVMAAVRSRVASITARERLESKITELAVTPESLDVLVNDYPDYDGIQAISTELEVTFDQVFEAVNARRATDRRGQYLEDLVVKLKPHQLKQHASGDIDLTNLAGILGVGVTWLADKFRELTAEEAAPEDWGAVMVDLYDGPTVLVQLALRDAAPLLENSMVGGGMVSVVHRGRFFDVTESDFELIGRYHRGELVNSEALEDESSADVDEMDATTATGDQLLHLYAFDHDEHQVMAQMSFSTAQDYVSLTPYQRKKDGWVDVIDLMGDDYRVSAEVWEAFVRYRSGEPEVIGDPTITIESADLGSSDELAEELADSVDGEVVESKVAGDPESRRRRLYPDVLALFAEFEDFGGIEMMPGVLSDGPYEFGDKSVSSADVWFVLETDTKARGKAMADAVGVSYEEFLQYWSPG